MPTYSYRCTECGEAFDIQQSFTDASLTVCPVCDGALRKVFSPIGVSFTGSGFYRNDSRTPPAGEKASAEKAGADKGASDKGGTEKKSEKAAPAAKEKTAASTPGTGSGTGKAATSSAAS